MRILQLCTRIPYPPNDGGSIAMYNIAKALTDAGCTIKVLAFNTKKHFQDASAIDKNFSSQFALETVYLDAEVKPLDAFINLFSSESYNIKRFYSKEFETQLIKILSAYNYDIVQMESLYMAPYLDAVRKYSKAKIVLRAHNIEHLIWQRMYNAEQSLFKKQYLKILYKRLYTYEKNSVNRFDALLPMTIDDANIFKILGCKTALTIIPIGIDIASYKKKTIKDSKPKLFHLGSMDWLPNIEAVNWFLKNVWDNLLKKIPDLELHIAGKAMPQHLFKQQSENLFVYGRIDDAKTFTADKQIMIVPLLSGSGMRVKIIEGLAAGNAIVSTTIGAEGIKYTNNKNILIADTPTHFNECIVKLFNDKNLIQSLSDNAIQLAQNEYDNAVIGKRLIEFYKTLLQ